MNECAMFKAKKGAKKRKNLSLELFFSSRICGGLVSMKKDWWRKKVFFGGFAQKSVCERWKQQNLQTFG